MKKQLTATITVRKNIMFPKGLIENVKGNSVRKDRELKAGIYTSKDIYYYSGHCDSYTGAKIVVSGYTFYVGESQVGNNEFNRQIDCPLQYVEINFR